MCCDPTSGERSGSEPLLTLASFRRTRGAINFGILLGSGRQVGAPSDGGQLESTTRCSGHGARNALQSTAQESKEDRSFLHGLTGSLKHEASITSRQMHHMKVSRLRLGMPVVASTN